VLGSLVFVYIIVTSLYKALWPSDHSFEVAGVAPKRAHRSDAALE